MIFESKPLSIYLAPQRYDIFLNCKQKMKNISVKNISLSLRQIKTWSMDLRIKEILHEKGVSMSWLSKETNIASETLYRVGSRNPTIGTLQKIADALGVPFIELFVAKGDCRDICPKWGMKFEVVAEPPKVTTTPSREAQKGSILEFVEKHAEKNGGNLTGLIKILREYGGGDVPVSQVDDKFYNGFLEFMKTAKKQAQGKVITEQHQKRIKGDFDKILDTTNTD